MENNWFIFTICIASIFNGLVGLAIGAAKHRAGFGFLLGILLCPRACARIATAPLTPPRRCVAIAGATFPTRAARPSA